MIKRISKFVVLALTLTATITSHAWLKFSAQANECFGQVGETELRVYVVDYIVDSPMGNNVYERYLNVHLLQNDRELLHQQQLVRDHAKMRSLSDTERLLKCIVSDDLEFYVVHFIGGKFLICRLDKAKNSLIFLYSSNAHSSLKLSLQYPNENECIVVDQTGRAVFTLNAVTGKSQLSVPAEGRGCVIM